MGMIYSNKKSSAISICVFYILMLFYLEWFCIDLNNKISTLENDMKSLDVRIDAIGDELKEIEEEIDTINNRVENMSNVIDSYSSAVYQMEHGLTEDTKEQIEEEIREGEIELLAQLIEAEAGNQDYTGKCLVADVVLNRVDSSSFPDTIEEVIFEKHQSKDGKWHWQFSTIMDGAFDKAAYYISEDSFKAAAEEYNIWKSGAYVSSPEILSFTAGNYNKYFKPAFKHGDHYFGY